MSKVDWSLAPEWADRVVAGPLSGNEYWANSQRRIQTNGEFDCPDQYHILESWDLICMRPKPWSGPEDGLPPVDTECEAELYKGGGWIKCKVAYVGSKFYVLTSDELTVGAECVLHLGQGSFRAIRTPEQLAAEERENAINEMIHEHEHAGLRSWAVHVYDTLGYRKQ